MNRPAYYDDVLRIAHAARAWAVKHNNMLEMFPSNLEGMCGIAAGYLLKQLHDAGYKQAVAVETDEHCFNLIDGYVLDITATQFGCAPVVFKPLTEINKRNSPWIVDPYTIRKTVAILRRKQKDAGWPCNQIVPMYVLNPSERTLDQWRQNAYNDERYC